MDSTCHSVTTVIRPLKTFPLDTDRTSCRYSKLDFHHFPRLGTRSDGEKQKPGAPLAMDTVQGPGGPLIEQHPLWFWARFGFSDSCCDVNAQGTGLVPSDASGLPTTS